MRKFVFMLWIYLRRIVMFYVNKRDINIIDLIDFFICDCFILNMMGRYYVVSFEEVLIENNIFKECFVGYI